MSDSDTAKKPWPWEAREPADVTAVRERSRQTPPPPPAGGAWWQPGPLAAFALGVGMTIAVVIVGAIIMAAFYGNPEGLSVFHETSVFTMLTAGGVWGLLIVTAWRR